jgi:hypothetical protein
VDVDETITCIDCGELAHRLTYPPEDGVWYPGDVVSYRCTGCGDRWDLEVPDEDDGDDQPAAGVGLL